MERLTLTHEGRDFIEFTLEELRAVGVPQIAIDAVVLQARVKDAKAECKRRIYTIASAETQLNMTAAAASISAKDTTDRSADEQAELITYGSAVSWVKAMRDNVGVLAADPDAQLGDDASWPDCPAEVIALADVY